MIECIKVMDGGCKSEGSATVPIMGTDNSHSYVIGHQLHSHYRHPSLFVLEDITT